MSRFHAYSMLIGIAFSFSCKHIGSDNSKLTYGPEETELEIEKQGYIGGGENCTCGLNFTRMTFDKWREEIVRKFNDFEPHKKVDFCRGMISKDYGDIVHFWGAERTPPEILGHVDSGGMMDCGFGQCRGAIGVSLTDDPYSPIGCYFAGEINYIQFGLGVHLCHNFYTHEAPDSLKESQYSETLFSIDIHNEVIFLLDGIIPKDESDGITHFLEKIKPRLTDMETTNSLLANVFKTALLKAEELNFPKSLAKVFIVAHRLTSQTKGVNEIYTYIQGRLDWFNVGWDMIDDSDQNQMISWTAPKQNKEPWRSSRLCMDDSISWGGSENPLRIYTDKLTGRISRITYGHGH